MRSSFKITLAVVTFLVFFFLIMFMPMTHKQGVDGDVMDHKICLYAKVGGFLYRDYEYRWISREITKGLDSEKDKVLAIYKWTIRHIKKNMPKDWPIVDDHILNIIIRGYGESDQMADVFTTLCAYSGMRAFWRVYHISDTAGQKPIASLVLSFVKIENKWCVFDIFNRRHFLNSNGQIASVDELIIEPALIKKNMGDFKVKGVPYTEFFKNVKPIRDVRYVRPERQMIFKRLLFEITKILKK